ncbi:TPA: DNA helicase RecG [Candidatus Gastranaerophilales bacterium HUM_6]|nr:aTP-dependent DNA helicase RecG [Fusobacterium sp. CAG:815]DAA90283.1 MAG TPA: DNA helicase RecG [Candidatus Gastranaerophilales bacterium HUM_6]DAA95165.1 MAG TPA: DNA helicase RecG [Candidatus Gastranaerophilales bacterium HUM_7]DAB02610.1 MAG TPA: DNA helicase RecG [Candidatus Gastranaerophilales bacterium HUM_12]DAB06327.1 MAG TPA: DNA helicase RecG [Candidatus Gastranaerophilales bacterium HUM_14]
MVENLEKIKAAIDIEIKYRYIDIHGKTQKFSSFIKKEAQKNYKLSKKNPRWEVVIESFEHYPYASITERRKAIEHLIRVIRADIQTQNQEQQEEKERQIQRTKHPSEVDVMYIKGVGPKVAYKLNKLGIFTAQDLMMYFPKKHIDYSSRTLIRDLKEGQTTTVFGFIKSVSSFNTRNNLSVTRVVIGDESGRFELSFFNAKGNRYLLQRMKTQFPQNAGIMVSGVVKMNNYSGQLTMDKPTYSIMTGEFKEDANSNLNIARIVPIYTICEDLSIKTLRKAIFNAIELYKNDIKNIVPDFIRERLGIMNKKDAVKQIHFPETMNDLEHARFSLIFEELFLIQLKLIRLRENTAKTTSAYNLQVHKDGLVQKFIAGLPFELTSGQKQAVNEILQDMNSDAPMQRLLQGDVGSGKTVVATIMLLAAVENGYQGALMAPTEILAQQHYNNLVQWLTPLGLSVGLFLGSHGKKVRQKFETDLKNGQMNIAVGTHALIQENVDFNNLGAIVVDEQHRFGVKQRNILKRKSQNPQMLTMTATPIPRTLALTVHGDLDLTVINELPKGRKPIKTILTGSHRQVWDLIKQEVESGRQAYIVYPLIDESETLSAKAATIEAEKLQQEIFPQFKIGLLHGKLKNDEKEEVMKDFKDGKYDILVSTTVVEVGVDVPNATVMVIENAERFGLSQLHQLRGRVGRSSLQSYCVLITSSRSQETLERLGIMTETNDGFVIAEKDLQLRGPGEFLGTRQSGLPDLIISDIVRDAKILEIARNEAIDFVKNYNIDDFPMLKNVTSLEMFTGLDI